MTLVHQNQHPNEESIPAPPPAFVPEEEEEEHHSVLTDSHSTSSTDTTDLLLTTSPLRSRSRTHSSSSSDSILKSNSQNRRKTRSMYSSAVLWVRTWRPWMPWLGFLAYMIYRCTIRGGGGPRRNLLQDLVQLLTFLDESVSQTMTTLVRLTVGKSNEGECHTMEKWIQSSVTEAGNLLQDGLALLALIGLTRLIYGAYHGCQNWSRVQSQLIATVFDWLERHVAAVHQQVQDQTDETIQNANEMLRKSPDRCLTLQLPAQGRSSQQVLLELQTAAQTEHETWSCGKLSGTVYHNPSAAHNQLLDQVYSAYAWCNPLHPGVWPKVGQCEGEVISMTGHLLHAPRRGRATTTDHDHDDHDDVDDEEEDPEPDTGAIGCITSGGTESILLAIRAHLQYYGKRRGIAAHQAELICGSTAHAAVDKACDLYGIRKIVIDCNCPNRGYQLDPIAVRQKITSRTIMIYASAPCYPQGVIDPIGELSDLAQEYDIGLHVDACLGGFVLPFCQSDDDDISVPAFDFRHAGVTSMSADTHKYGYASKGTSVVLYRHEALRHGQYFCYPHWTGGLYTTPTLAGSRAGALSACAWAAMVSIGYEGYRQRALTIVRAARLLAAGVAAIPELQVLTETPYMLVCFGAANEADDDDESSFCIYRVQDMMKNRGWALNAMQSPASIHMCVTLNVAPKVSEFLCDLQEAVSQAREEGSSGRKKGTAGIYGTVGSVPAGAVEPTLRAFTDMTLAP
eukprot:CAMPEP_0172451524 /NCGR_PEP_ID=MMETSP1065-20121228/9539_1 /TAXON_ID=265537 /ORGANISM="Amphiprora paludosa, Strain CCMP125" /LENGTH=737 /DNA_ID=CAMNT_0013203487 /DNA_START=471 /DNA_END=2684 /DNA_ORIENTATION=-